MDIDSAPVEKISADHLSRLLDHIPSMLAYWGRDLRCRFANKAYEQWFGIDDASRLIGTSIRDLLGPDLFRMNEAFILGALRGEHQTFERVIPGPGGRRRHSLAHYMPDVIDGEVRGFVALVTETTLLKETETVLRDSEQKFRMLSESSPWAVLQTDDDLECNYANARWLDISGLQPGQSAGGGWTRALHPDDRHDALARWRSSAPRGAVFETEFRIQRPDGSVRTAWLRAQPAGASTGQLKGWVCTIEDTTKRREAEQRLRASKSFLERTGRIVAAGGWEIDLATGHVIWSAQTRRIHEVAEDYSPRIEETIQFYSPEARPMIEAAVEAARREGTAWDLELPFVTARGNRLWVRTFGEVEYEQGKAVRLVGAFQDVTEHRQKRIALQEEQQLRIRSERHARELDRLLQERNEMLDVLAHEVRQPLNNASAALQSASATLLEMGEGVASTRLGRAQSVMSRVLASIDNTLAVASLLARPGAVQAIDTDIEMLVAVTIADLPEEQRPRVSIQKVTTTRTASMDMNLMRLALRNLLTNALKYSHHGSPVTVRLADSDHPLALIIEVTNSGPAIDRLLVPHLFERGPHRAKGTGHPMQGLGLGLYIVRRVMELHGSQVELVRNLDANVTMRLVLRQ
jgi:PAS domain S-box-containing protein